MSGERRKDDERSARSKTRGDRDPSSLDDRGDPSLMSRREFTWSLLAVTGAMALPLGSMGCAGNGGEETAGAPPRLLYIALDGLHPDYLDLDITGRKSQPGDTGVEWLMPNLRAFRDQATSFAHARCHLPSATDMNHLNALAGTRSTQTGVLGVSMQVVNWDADGTEKMRKPHLSWLRDGEGRPVDTLFNSWKRKYPRSRTAFISGKFWIADMYRATMKNIDKQSDSDPDDIETGYRGDIDLFVTGEDPGLSAGLGIPAPTADPNNTFFDPATDADAQCDPESPTQRAFVQAIFQLDPVSFPPDGWVVDAALSVLGNETARPDLGWVLLAQSDDAQHALGTAWDPDEFAPRVPRIPPEALGCIDRDNPDDWQLVSRRNVSVFREAVLDTIRDIDVQFGRLWKGIREIEYYKDATIVVYSDHSQVTHLQQRDVRPENALDSTNPVTVLLRGGAITAQEAAGDGFFPLTFTSVGMLHWKAGTVEARQARAAIAKTVMEAYRVTNHVTGVEECPWLVLDHAVMKAGIRDPGDARLGAEPGELWHEHFGPQAELYGDAVLWPDVILLMRNGWQLPVLGGNAGNIGVDINVPIPPLTLFVGGHGAPDTQPILMAVSGPGIAKKRVVTDPDYEQNHRIADLAITMARRFGLDLGLSSDRNETVGRDRSSDLGA